MLGVVSLPVRVPTIILHTGGSTNCFPREPTGSSSSSRLRGALIQIVGASRLRKLEHSGGVLHLSRRRALILRLALHSPRRPSDPLLHPCIIGASRQALKKLWTRSHVVDPSRWLFYGSVIGVERQRPTIVPSLSSFSPSFGELMDDLMHDSAVQVLYKGVDTLAGGT